jgi:hypothetical protein
MPLGSDDQGESYAGIPILEEIVEAVVALSDCPADVSGQITVPPLNIPGTGGLAARPG